MTTLVTAAKETIDNKDCKPDFRAQRFSRKHGLVEGGGGGNSREPTNLVPILVI